MFPNTDTQVALPDIKFSTINVRSLNLSDTTGATPREKLNFIISKGCDIIALSEVKFHDLSQLPWITNFLSAKNFTLVINSTETARG